MKRWLRACWAFAAALVVVAPLIPFIAAWEALREDELA